jgi:hypothetical protein
MPDFWGFRDKEKRIAGARLLRETEIRIRPLAMLIRASDLECPQADWECWRPVISGWPRARVVGVRSVGALAAALAVEREAWLGLPTAFT